MQNKKVVILAVLGIIALISIISGLSAKPKWQRSDTGRNPAVKNELVVPNKDIAGQTKRHARRTQFHSWGRNVFIPKGVAGTASSKLFLSGILEHGKEFKAMIGDAIVGKGDTIDGNKVVDVRRDRVILNDGKRDFELKLAK